MKIHKMQLDKKYFDEILSGRKLIEIRLNDEKRNLIKIGDQINFLLRDGETNALVTVVDITTFANLESLLNTYDLSLFGNLWKTKDDALKNINYYSNDQIKKHGVLAIKIELLEKF